METPASIDRLCLMTVHAHPDDESSKGAGTVARYSDEGVRTVLVCCTGGEEGEVLNPKLDREAIADRLHEVRRDELIEAAAIIGYDRVDFLGYRDSGMPDSEANHHPDAFAQAPLEEAVGRLVALIREERPHVIVTYSDDQQGYQHPDHLRVHDISVPAFHAAADPDAYPGTGEPWQALKLYYTVWSRERIAAMHAKYAELGVQSPYDENWFTRPSSDHRITAKVDVGEWFPRRSKALLAHATQVDPSSPFWFGLPDEAAAAAYPYDDYILGHTMVETTETEDDLFAGIRELSTT